MDIDDISILVLGWLLVVGVAACVLDELMDKPKQSSVVCHKGELMNKEVYANYTAFKRTDGTMCEESL